MSPFLPSDSWLLHAIGLAGQTTPASLRDIISAGDYINHAIFTWEEMESGLGTLIALELIEFQTQSSVEIGIQLHPNFVGEYARQTGKTKAIFKQGEALKKYLQSLSLPDQPDVKILPFNQEHFEHAVRSYINPT